MPIPPKTSDTKSLSNFEKRMAKIANVFCNNANTIFQVMENNNRGESVENATKLIEPRISSN